MNLKPLGSNKTQLDLSDGTSVLFSYKTPVAAFVPGVGYVKTEKKWSVTTSKHISQWCGQCPTRPQEFFDSLISA